MAEQEAPTEGWGIIVPPAKKAHYFRDTMSLCRTRGFYFGPLNADEYRSPDDCAACRKVLDREAAQKAAGR